MSLPMKIQGHIFLVSFVSCYGATPSTCILNMDMELWNQLRPPRESWFLNFISVSWHHITSFKLTRGKEFTVEIRKFCNLKCFKVVLRRSGKLLSKHLQHLWLWVYCMFSVKKFILLIWTLSLISLSLSKPRLQLISLP